MTRVTETEYEVEKKEIERTLIECDASGCYNRVEPSEATTVAFYEHSSPDEPIANEHLCPEHTNAPELIELEASRDRLEAIADGVTGFSIDVAVPIGIFAGTLWVGLYIGRWSAAVTTGNGWVDMGVAFVIWMFLATITMGTISE